MSAVASTLAVTVGTREALVSISFAQPVTWIGLPPGEAKQLAELIIRFAEDLEQKSGNLPEGPLPDSV